MTVLAPLLLLIACAPAPGECTFPVSTAFTQMEDGTYEHLDCYEIVDGGYDFTDCCPPPYSVMGITSLSEVICG